MENSVLKQALGLHQSVIENVRVEANSIVISARPRKKALRCPVCKKRCDAYDTLPARRWRTLDIGGSRCYIEYAPRRVECADHGVRSEALPWARSAKSRFTSAFEDLVAWLSLDMCRSALSELMRVSWRSVGSICKRVADDLEEQDGHDRFSDLRAIGIDETSYKKGYKYITVIVDHDKGRIVWATKGYGKRQLNDFFDLLTDKQRSSIKVVTADGARWIAETVAERLPGAELAVDPFHVVSWATDALDELRRKAWQDARKTPPKKRHPGRPKKGEKETKDPAKEVKGLRYPLLKNPENLSDKQACALDALKKSGGLLWRGYLLKEGLRAVFKAGEGASEALDRWLSWACRCRIPSFVELSRKIRKKKDAILRSVELGVSNARVEAVNNKIKIAIRQGYGFRNVDNLIALVMLRCSDLKPKLPGREDVLLPT